MKLIGMVWNTVANSFYDEWLECATDARVRLGYELGFIAIIAAVVVLLWG